MLAPKQREFGFYFSCTNDCFERRSGRRGETGRRAGRQLLSEPPPVPDILRRASPLGRRTSDVQSQFVSILDKKITDSPTVSRTSLGRALLPQPLLSPRPQENVLHCFHRIQVFINHNDSGAHSNAQSRFFSVGVFFYAAASSSSSSPMRAPIRLFSPSRNRTK